MSEETAIMPGARLRRAREEQGLSPEEVSRQLRLSLSYLKALENDDYGRLPEPTFVKGYLRNYARLVGLPAEELAHQFQQEVDEQQNAEDERQRQALAERPRRRDWRLPLLAALSVALLVALGWWLWPRHDVPPTQTEPRWQTPRETPADPDPVPRRSEPTAPDDSLGPPNEGTGETVAPAENGDAPALPGEAGESALADGAEPAATGQLESTATGVAEQSSDRIGLSFSRLCWVRVVDATGATLSQGQREAGDRLDLEGEAPFRLTVGDAAAVASVSLNGESVSLPSQRSGDVVRVTLP